MLFVLLARLQHCVLVVRVEAPTAKDSLADGNYDWQID
jgi:hypothetical protein